MCTSSAVAQTRSEPSPAPVSQPDNGDVTVVGLRQSNNAAIKTKRDSLNIVDAIGANDVRELPAPPAPRSGRGGSST